jgi:hypothetical protein
VTEFGEGRSVQGGGAGQVIANPPCQQAQPGTPRARRLAEKLRHQHARLVVTCEVNVKACVPVTVNVPLDGFHGKTARCDLNGSGAVFRGAPARNSLLTVARVHADCPGASREFFPPNTSACRYTGQAHLVASLV